jgi:hypothetical protein
MAKRSRKSSLFGTNDWKALYKTFNRADFSSYSYETLRKAFVDYLQANYPETFNDYVESSEFVALLDVIAFMGQGLAFRNDLNARENFIDTAERRDSVIKLANLVGYTPKRNIAGQGFLKVISIKTTQNISDINGFNLSNVPVLWNDPANPNWLEQFNSIINAALIDTQRIGRPGNVSEIGGIKISEYSLRIPSNSLPVVPFTRTVDNISMNFELCSVSTVDSESIYELPPAPNGIFNIIYRNDQLGFGSPNTGFFFYFKQGTLQQFDFSLTQQISNQTIDINIQGINNSDTWLYQFGNNNEKILWKQVDNVYSAGNVQGIKNKKIFSVSSRFNDQVTYVFGDGSFSEIPVGNFRAYVRAGNALTYTIFPTDFNGLGVSFNYISRFGRVETLTIGLALTQTITTAQSRETLDSIKLRAPTRYYTQNRMVNGEDYNNFPFTLYNSIIKSKAINRSSIGVSRNLDLLDPTGKFSSTNNFGTDGAIYLDDSNGFLNLTINDTNDIIAFFTSTLTSVLASNRASQYYVQFYPRYTVDLGTDVIWQTSIVNSSNETGFFYTRIGSLEQPQNVGTFTTNTLKYITPGAILKFIAPPGFYFDNNNRLVSGIPKFNDKTFIWSTVLNVIGDGSNNGKGSFSNGNGPIQLNGFVPDGAILSQIIPAFGNIIPNSVIQEALMRMELQQDFTLLFNNSLPISQNRWSVGRITNDNWFVKFICLGNNRYSITYRSLTYYFGSVRDTRFIFNEDQMVYDPFTGKTLQDNINILGVNTLPNTSINIGRDIIVNILGQTVESDGYVNDYQVEIGAVDINNKQIILDPDFFNTVTGYVNNSQNVGVYAFFETVQDAFNLTRTFLVPEDFIKSQYATKTQIELVKFEYPLGQVFYAFGENKFYKTVQDQTATFPVYNLVEQPQYSMKPGRGGLSFKYKHNSNNSTRIDPATTNIIDIYLVPFGYYDRYRKWAVDSTGTVTKPDKPTILELTSQYSDIQNYKMLSDSVVLNSVEFKPLFGSKAEPALRATIKVVKANNTNVSDSEIRSRILTAMNDYFDINNWDFGDTFYFSELSAFLHSECGDIISAVVLVPNDPNKKFGELYEIRCKPFEIFINAATADDIQVVSSLNPNELQAR